jgi:hypothetical protein
MRTATFSLLIIKAIQAMKRGHFEAGREAAWQRYFARRRRALLTMQYQLVKDVCKWI